jgi:hypothetical protein
MGEGMPEDMTISKVGASRTFETQHGKFVSYRIELEGHGEAELVQKPETPVPAVGQSVFGELVPGKEGFPPKLKKAKPQGGGNWASKDSPDQRRSIERQVSAKIAAELVVAGVAKLDQFRDLTDRVHAAIEGN